MTAAEWAPWATALVSIVALGIQALTNRAMLDRQDAAAAEARRQERIQDAYLIASRYILRQSAIEAWVEVHGTPTVDRPLPLAMPGPEGALEAVTAVNIFGSVRVQTLFAEWLRERDEVQGAASSTTKKIGHMQRLVELNRNLLVSMNEELTGQTLPPELTEPPNLVAKAWTSEAE